jgi:two-component system sensor histidine kinase VicK
MDTEKYSLQILQDIGKISPHGMLVYDIAADSVLYCNKALAKILNQTIAEIMEGGWTAIRKALKDEQEFLYSAFEEFRSASKVAGLELRIVSSNGKYVSVDAFLVGDRDTIVVSARDITKTKEHLNYIVEFGARKNTILDAISHSLSGPLNMVNSLMDVVDQVSKTQQYNKMEHPARLIRENTQQCIDLISSFLREEHLASPMVPIEANRFDALAKIKVVVNRYAEFNPTKQIKVVGPGSELFVTGDDVKFFQIVNNLVSNAVKYTGEKGVITVEVRERNSVLVVSVRDNGIGIPDYLQPHLFKKNTPAARPGLRGERSIGLGLYIIKKLVDLMDGSITVESTEGKGSTFTVVFPGMMR